jgi:UTP:GlnB (protein PII) uridylyltransferase
MDQSNLDHRGLGSVRERLGKRAPKESGQTSPHQNWAEPRRKAAGRKVNAHIDITPTRTSTYLAVSLLALHMPGFLASTTLATPARINELRLQLSEGVITSSIQTVSPLS